MSASPLEREPAVVAPTDELADWRRRLLPFMQIVVGVLALYFIVASEVRFQRFQTVLTAERPHGAVPEIANPDRDAAGMEAAARIALEAEALERRYRQANTLILSRAWTRYMAFATGMVLALVGAAFVLGRLQETTKLTADLPGKGGGSLESSSPGLFLALFGTVLMGLAVASGVDVTVTDAPVYIRPSEGAIRMPTGAPQTQTQTKDDNTIMNFDPRDSTAHKGAEKKK